MHETMRGEGTEVHVQEALAWAANHSPTRIVLAPGASAQVGVHARECGASHALLVTDPGIEEAGHLVAVMKGCAAAGLRVSLFDAVGANPTTEHVTDGLRFAQAAGQTGNPIDFIIGLGGGSAMDCAKGINLLLTNGGEVRDYWGINKPAQPLLPSILVPTTAGTGSEAQSFALITDESSHVKMACGDRRLPRAGGLRPLLAILDPNLTATVPNAVRAAVAVDAVSHAVETAACKARTETSRRASILAWRLLRDHFESSLRSPEDAESRTAMLVGAHLAGVAIEQSMLGAAHACANPLTARYDIVHGVAVGLMLTTVVRFNSAGLASNDSPYADLGPTDEWLDLLRHWTDLAGIPRNLKEAGVSESDLPQLSQLAASQWTAQFNPRPVTEADMLALYRAAFRQSMD